MAVSKRPRTASKSVPAKAAPRKAVRKPAPSPKSARADVTVYADKEATDYHKAFARWIVQEVGFDPDTAASKRSAFLRGVSIATAARPAFMESDFLAEWRDKTGVVKRGPKPKAAEEEAPVRRTRKPAPVEVVEEDDFDDEDTDEIEEDEDDFDDDAETDDEDDFDDEDSDDESEDEDDFDDDVDEVEEAPAPRRGRPAKAASKPVAKRAPVKAAKAAPARRGRPAKDDDEFLF